MTKTTEKYAILGAGPCGLGVIRQFSKKNIPFQAFEYHDAVGGIWNSENPLSTMYNSAHLISSKGMTQYDEFPFDENVADFPHNTKIKEYFKGYADKFNLSQNVRFNSIITSVTRNDDGMWTVSYKDRLTQEEHSDVFKGVVLATGLFNKGNENMPKWEGMETFPGEILHAANYKSNDSFAGKRVLVVGCGNSAADIAIDAVHRGKSVDMSVRRGYYFVPKYIFGKPMDTANGLLKGKIPFKIKREIDKKILKWFAGDPVKFGFPKPDYNLYESHPVVNSYLLQHVGHGDINIVKDVKKFEGDKVHFSDGSVNEYDIVLTATGYHINFKYIDKGLLNWHADRPDLHLNVFHPEYDNLYIAGMIEATGIGWQGRMDQAEMIASYVDQKDKAVQSKNFEKFDQERIENNTDLSNGTQYIKLARMAYYVDKDVYMAKVSSSNNSLNS